MREREGVSHAALSVSWAVFAGLHLRVQDLRNAGLLHEALLSNRAMNKKKKDEIKTKTRPCERGESKPAKIPRPGQSFNVSVCSIYDPPFRRHVIFWFQFFFLISIHALNAFITPLLSPDPAAILRNSSPHVIPS